MKRILFTAVLFVSALAASTAAGQPAKGQEVKIYAAAVKTPLTAIADEGIPPGGLAHGPRCGMSFANVTSPMDRLTSVH
jgi:hypothetical protein